MFTTPLAFTVAYFVFEDVQRSFLLAFFVAFTFAFNLTDFPAFTGLFPVSFTFLTIPFMEVTFQEAFAPLPSAATAVITAFLPPLFFFSVTTPVWVTVTAFGLLDFQRIFLFVAVSGRMATVSFSFLPAAILFDKPCNFILFTFICFAAEFWEV